MVNSSTSVLQSPLVKPGEMEPYLALPTQPMIEGAEDVSASLIIVKRYLARRRKSSYTGEDLYKYDVTVGEWQFVLPNAITLTAILPKFTMTDTDEKKSAEFDQPGFELGELQSEPVFSPDAEKQLVRKVDLMYVHSH